jgi:hypothetical protein
MIDLVLITVYHADVIVRWVYRIVGGIAIVFCHVCCGFSSFSGNKEGSSGGSGLYIFHAIVDCCRRSHSLRHQNFFKKIISQINSS